MLNGIKLDLLWGRNNGDQADNEFEDDSRTNTYGVPSTTIITSNCETITSVTHSTANSMRDGKGHVRRPSTASVASSNSATISDSESELSTENDSGIESECKHETDRSRDLAKQYHKHLLGLYRCLEQMTDAANYLTARYQNDIGSV